MGFGPSTEDQSKAGNRHKPEEIVAKLRHGEVLQSQGATAADAIRRIGVTEVTYDRWRKAYGVRAEQLSRFKELEKENERLCRAVSDLTLDKLILKEAAKGTEGPRQRND